jgi:predicted O-methyltransferase YrrM
VPPSLDDMLVAGGGSFRVTAEDFLQSLGWTDIEFLRDEYRESSEQLSARFEQQRDRLPFPRWFRIEEETGFFLYAAVRLLRPEKVVETGVANGHSSFLILAALDRNHSGRLHSFDIDHRAGALVGRRDNWSLTVSPEDEASTRLAAAISELASVDIFFHDASHHYISQLIEYRTVWPAMSSGGLFVSDDVDDSRAFFDFSEEVGRTPSLLFDRRKVVGAHRLP